MAVILGRSRRAHSRRALGFPLDPPPRPLVVRPPERPTSQGGFAACPLRFAQGAATPPWTPGLSPRGPLLRSVPRARGDPQLVRFASLRGLLLPPGPPSPATVGQMAPLVVVEVSIEIAAPPEAVWDRLVDWENLGLWMKEARDFRVISPERE